MSSARVSALAHLSRRAFLHRSAMTVGGALLAAPALAASQECRPTEPDILGPFYRFGAPFQSKSQRDNSGEASQSPSAIPSRAIAWRTRSWK